MKLYSTNNTALRVGFEEAVFQALPSDNGLYMPEHMPQLPDSFWENLQHFTVADIGVELSKHLLGSTIDPTRLESLVRNAIDFQSPLSDLKRTGYLLDQYTLELFHGPSLAFKDFGARFMSAIMTELLVQQGRRLNILVATSGDTGGAVAAGFLGSPNIDVTILYPSGKVSDVQEAQLTSLGHNISAIRIDGTFDDCQSLVKQAFLDDDLRSRVNISSANSINISRLIPQTFYYFDAYRQWLSYGIKQAPVFAVPSGNFGNLTAGVMAMKMGLPVRKFVAASNANDPVVEYWGSGEYKARASVATLSNAMDVGSPSNFSRLEDLFGSTWNTFKSHVFAASFSDEQTAAKLKQVYEQTKSKGKPGYVLDPHTAVGVLALEAYQKTDPVPGIVLGTAHYGKFLPDVERIIGEKLPLPEALSSIVSKPRRMTDMPVDYGLFRNYVLDHWNNKR